MLNPSSFEETRLKTEINIRVCLLDFEVNLFLKNVTYYVPTKKTQSAKFIFEVAIPSILRTLRLKTTIIKVLNKKYIRPLRDANY